MHIEANVYTEISILYAQCTKHVNTHIIIYTYTYTNLLLPAHPLALLVPFAYEQLYTVVHDVGAEHLLLEQLAYIWLHI